MPRGGERGPGRSGSPHGCRWQRWDWNADLCFQRPSSSALCFPVFLLQPVCGFCLVNYFLLTSSPRKRPKDVFFLKYSLYHILGYRYCRGLWWHLTLSCISASAPLVTRWLVVEERMTGRSSGWAQEGEADNLRWAGAVFDIRRPACDYPC